MEPMSPMYSCGRLVTSMEFCNVPKIILYFVVLVMNIFSLRYENKKNHKIKALNKYSLLVLNQFEHMFLYIFTIRVPL